jgi:hypothetical protein
MSVGNHPAGFLGKPYGGTWTFFFSIRMLECVMSKPRKSLKKPRQSAFTKQKGLCYYCAQTMWNGSPQYFSSRYGLIMRQTRRYQCAGKHLSAHKDGGCCDPGNIVAACLFCNVGRHKRKRELDVGVFKELVQRRMNAGRWHDARVAT